MKNNLFVSTIMENCVLYVRINTHGLLVYICKSIKYVLLPFHLSHILQNHYKNSTFVNTNWLIATNYPLV